MSTTETLKRKIATALELQSVVKTMKSLAAVSIRQYEKAVASLAQYNRTLEMGMQILLYKHPESLIGIKPTPTRRLAVVIFGSDQGMCGQFNEKIAEFILEQLNNLSLSTNNIMLVTVGLRIKDRLESAGQPCELCYTVPSSIAGITPIVQEIVLTLEKWRTERQIERIMVFANRPLSNSAYRPHQQQLFPPNLHWLQQLKQKPWSTRTLPTHTMSQEQLAAALFRQHFFVSLYRACAESLASENASRLASMQIAEKNISERLNQLQTEFHHQRQTAITEELLDIVSGFETLTSK